MKLMLSVVTIRAHDYALRFKEGILADNQWLLAYEAIPMLCQASPLPAPYIPISSVGQGKSEILLQRNEKKKPETLEIVLKLLLSSIRLLDDIK